MAFKISTGFWKYIGTYVITCVHIHIHIRYERCVKHNSISHHSFVRSFPSTTCNYMYIYILICAHLIIIIFFLYVCTYVRTIRTNVYRNATQNEIKDAYRKMAMAFHPDRHEGCEIKTDAFKEATEAYQVLSGEWMRMWLIVNVWLCECVLYE